MPTLPPRTGTGQHVATNPRKGQLDLFADLDAATRAADEATTRRRVEDAPSMFDTGTAGYGARLDAIDAWIGEYGSFRSFIGAHGWYPNMCPPPVTNTNGGCQPVTLAAELRCGHRDETCFCVGELLFRAACVTCDFEGDTRVNENAAGEDAHDHAWPGWRNLPIVPHQPTPNSGSARESGSGRTAFSAWLTRVNATYPQGWLARGGPIRTHRKPGATRHIPAATVFGGWDLATTTAITAP